MNRYSLIDKVFLLRPMSAKLTCVALLMASLNSQATTAPPSMEIKKSLLEFTVSKINSSESAWIGERIYQNECASDPKYLTYWGKGEEFPSLGIGHFIWYTSHYQAPYHETFPDMVEFVSTYSTPPLWLIDLKPFKAPWGSKKIFDQAWSSKEMTELRNWLLETKSLQADFIVLQFKERLAKSMDELSAQEPNKVLAYHALIRELSSFKEGRFALIDYVNFKGVGNQNEQYQGQQWGLFSVLEEMSATLNTPENKTTTPTSQKALMNHFVKAAKLRLSKRVSLAPKERHEQRWLEGWFSRLDGYLLN